MLHRRRRNKIDQFQARRILSHGHFYSWADIEQTLDILEKEMSDMALECPDMGYAAVCSVYAAALKV